MPNARSPEIGTKSDKTVIGAVEPVEINRQVSAKPAGRRRPQDGQGHSFGCRFRVENRGSQPVRLMGRRWRLCDAFHHLTELHGPCIPGQQPKIQPGSSYSFQVTLGLATEWGSLSGALNFEGSVGEVYEVAFEELLLTPRGMVTSDRAHLSQSSL